MASETSVSVSPPNAPANSETIFGQTIETLLYCTRTRLKCYGVFLSHSLFFVRFNCNEQSSLYDESKTKSSENVSVVRISLLRSAELDFSVKTSFNVANFAMVYLQTFCIPPLL